MYALAWFVVELLTPFENFDNNIALNLIFGILPLLGYYLATRILVRFVFAGIASVFLFSALCTIFGSPFAAVITLFAVLASIDLYLETTIEE
ncbi:MAG TPA: hypothetical protein VF676_03080 [Flavobacterium sp.]|jgi:hypothetical protein